MREIVLHTASPATRTQMVMSRTSASTVSAATGNTFEHRTDRGITPQRGDIAESNATPALESKVRRKTWGMECTTLRKLTHIFHMKAH